MCLAYYVGVSFCIVSILVFLCSLVSLCLLVFPVLLTFAVSLGFRVYEQMLRWFPKFQVVTTCFSCSPPDLNLLVTNFIFCIHVKEPLPPGDNQIAVYYYYYYYELWIFSTDFRKNYQISNFIKIHPVGTEFCEEWQTDGQGVGRTDSQTDMTKPIATFRNFVKSA